MRLIKLIMLVVCLFCNFAEAEDKSRPKIGLALAGGGALGFAHIGVLKVLEANRIPVDLVTGTSMGAIVGAAYASGRTLADMEKLLSETDWDELFNESSARRHVPYRYKAGREREIYGDVKFGFNDKGMVLPAGIVSGQYVVPVLQRLYDNVPSPVVLSELPLPFRAVTADIETGKAYIPEKGDLATIVRASMSVPAAFAPVDIDGKLLVDGGIANNLPIDEVKKMGAETTIAIELYADFKNREQLNSSPLAITGQIISLLLAQNSALQRQLLNSNDILIEPKIKGYSATDFAKSKELIAIGEAAAKEALPRLQKLVVSEEEYRKFSESRIRTTKQEEIIDFIEVKTDGGISKDRLLKQLRVKKGDKLDRKLVEKDVKGIYETGQFSDVKYNYIEKDGQQGLVIEAKKKEWFDRFIRVGAAFEDDFDGNSFYRLGGNYRINEVNTSGAFVDLNAEVGRTPGISAELYQPFSDESPYFFAPTIRYGSSLLGVRDEGDIIAQYMRTSGQVDMRLGRQLGQSGEFSIGGVRGFGDLERDIGDNTLPEFSYDVGEAFAKIVVDDLDAPDFPTEGTFTRLAFRSSTQEMGASDDFNDISGSFVAPITSGRNTFMLKAEFAHTFEDRPVERSYSLGGFLNISGFQQQSVLASDYTLGQVVYFHKFSELKIPLFGFGFFGGGTFEMAHVQSDIASINDSVITAGSVFIGADTPLIPVYFGYGINDQDDSSVYMAIGRINNQRAQ